MNYGENQ